MNVIGWPSNVNQKVLSDTTIITGDGGFKEDKSDNGWSQRRANSFIYPDKYNVVMDFDWEIEDINGMTEYNRFLNWYKFISANGANVFEFPSINKQLNINGSAKMCHYKITSPLNQTESGSCMRITMTWEEVFSGYIEASFHQPTIQSITREANGKCLLTYYGGLSVIPPTGEIILKRKVNSSSSSSSVTIPVQTTHFVRDDIVRITYEPISVSGEWLVYVNNDTNLSFVEIV